MNELCRVIRTTALMSAFGNELKLITRSSYNPSDWNSERDFKASKAKDIFELANNFKKLMDGLDNENN